MQSRGSKLSISSILLLLFGTYLLLMGVYFVFLRPPLLPEDLRFMGASQAQLETLAPRLTAWLSHVVRLMGGFVSAAGILTIALAATLFRSHHRGIGVAMVIAGLASIALMTAVNFRIASDFRWGLFGAALLWACGMVSFWVETLQLDAVAGALKAVSGEPWRAGSTLEAVKGAAAIRMTLCGRRNPQRGCRGGVRLL